MRILIMGPPGSGKGTQGERLAAHFRIPHISVGDLLRSEVDARTPLGLQAAEVMQSGDLLGDDLIFELVTPYIENAANEGGFVLDGFPRNLVQAVAARQVANDLNADADVAVWLDVPPRLLIERLTERSSDGRSDDTAETIGRRLQVYEDATRPLLDYYQGRGLLITVDAAAEPDEVTVSILALIESHVAAAGRSN